MIDEIKSEQNITKNSSYTLLWLIVGLALSIVLTCATVTVWHFRDTWSGVSITTGILSATMLVLTILYLRNITLQLALYRLIVIVTGIGIGMLLVPRTEQSFRESILQNALMTNNKEILLSMQKESSLYIEKCLLTNMNTHYHVAEYLTNIDKEIAIPILENSYKKATNPQVQLSILHIATNISDEKIYSLLHKAYKDETNEKVRLSILNICTGIENEKIKAIFEEALTTDNLEEIIFATNYLTSTNTPEEKLGNILQEKLSILLEGLKNSQSPESIAVFDKESIARFVSILLGKKSIPQILTTLKENPTPELIDILGRIGDKRAVESLEGLAKNSSDKEIQNECITSLGFMNDKKALAFLKDIQPSAEENLALHNHIQNSVENLEDTLGLKKVDIDSNNKEKIENTIKDIGVFLSTVNNYSLETSCKIWTTNVDAKSSLMSEMFGKICYKKNKLFLIEQTSVMYTSKKQENYIFSYFDGKNQWYYAGEKKYFNRNLYKFNLDEFVFPGRPFDVWPIPGTGLMPGEDYLQTVHTFLFLFDYDSVEENSETKIRTLHGTMNKRRMMEYLAVSGQLQVLKDQKLLDAMAKSHGEINLSILKDGRVTEWEIISHQPRSFFQNSHPNWVKNITFETTKFEINTILNDDLFVIDPNIAAKATDIGKNLANIFEKRIRDREKAMAFVKNKLQSKE